MITYNLFGSTKHSQSCLLNLGEKKIIVKNIGQKRSCFEEINLSFSKLVNLIIFKSSLAASSNRFYKKNLR